MRALAAVAVVVAAALVLSAGAFAMTPTLSISTLSVDVASVAPGDSIEAEGKVANRGDAGAPATVTVSLRAGNGATIALGTDTIRRVKAHAKAAYAVTGRIPDRLVAGRYDVVACVKRACKASPRKLTVLAPASATSGNPPAASGAASAGAETAPEPVAPAAAPEPEAGPQPIFHAGARSGGDTLFVDIGNGGYDALHYDLDLSYDIPSKLLQGTATITAVATENLNAFSLDFQNLAVNSVTVDGRAASFSLDFAHAKLDVVPAGGLVAGSTFTVVVAYGGIEQPVIDPDGSSEGWIANTTFGATALGEPIGSQGWFPNNNVPYDKATFDIRMTVPDGITAISNGSLVSSDSAGGFTTWHWNERYPMSTYLAMVTLGRLDVTGSVFTDPLRPLHIAVENTFTTGKATMIANQRRVPAILDYYSGFYGVPYMYETAGGVVPRINVGYSLETMTKPVYATTTSATSSGPTLATIAHENGHMWFGDYVTLRQWKDIWLNEGMTEWSSWLWQERSATSPMTTSVRFTTAYNGTSATFWNIPPADPPEAGDIFDGDAMYTRGAMVMEAIRQIVGEPAFQQIQKTWLQEHAFSNATTAEYIALVKRLTTKPPERWTEFFRQWLYTSYTGAPAAGNKPQMTPANFDTFPLPPA